jgi:hypothetical protein
MKHNLVLFAQWNNGPCYIIATHYSYACLRDIAHSNCGSNGLTWGKRGTQGSYINSWPVHPPGRHKYQCMIVDLSVGLSKESAQS